MVGGGNEGAVEVRVGTRGDGDDNRDPAVVAVLGIGFVLGFGVVVLPRGWMRREELRSKKSRFERSGEGEGGWGGEVVVMVVVVVAFGRDMVVAEGLKGGW